MVDAHVSLGGIYTLAYLQEYVDAAIAKGMDELVVLEPTHMFHECALLYQEVIATYPCQRAWYESIRKVSIVQYQQFITEMHKQAFPITVRFGLCVCYFTQHEYVIAQMKKAFAYDVFVGTIQFVDNIAFSWEDASFTMMWKKYNADFLYRRYYEMMNAMLTSGLFDGVSGFDDMKLLQVYPKFRMEHTYQKMAMRLLEHHMYVEDDSDIAYRYHHSDRGLDKRFRAMCEHYHVVIRTCSRAQKPQDVGRNITG